MALIFWVVAFMVLCVPIVWGLLDMYGCYRFMRNKEVDDTAGALWWWQCKAMLTTQPRRMIKAFPWLSQDLAEHAGLRPDDGEIT